MITCERQEVNNLGNNFHNLPKCLPMNPSQFGLVSSIYTLGGLMGALLAGPVATKYGRLLALRVATAFFILGPMAETLAPNISLLILGRFLSGVGSGAAIVVGPIYISEVAPSNARGFFGAFTQVMANLGILLSQTLGYFWSNASHWRWILAVAGMIGASQSMGLFLVPESPLWLTEHNKLSQARRVLQQIRGRDAEIEAEIASWGAVASPGEEEALLASSDDDTPKRAAITFMQFVRDPYYRPALIAVVGVMVAQQFTGINSIVMYSVSLLQSILPTTATLLTVMISAINLVVTLLCSPLPDRIGRKTCLMLSICGMGCSSILLAISISMDGKILTACAAFLFVFSFALGLGPVPFILASELVGPEAVGAAQSWALGANWVATFVIAQFFPILNDALGGRGKVYWMFAVMAGLFGGFIYRYIPETRGKAHADEVWGRADRRQD